MASSGAVWDRLLPAPASSLSRRSLASMDPDDTVVFDNRNATIVSPFIIVYICVMIITSSRLRPSRNRGRTRPVSTPPVREPGGRLGTPRCAWRAGIWVLRIPPAIVIALRSFQFPEVLLAPTYGRYNCFSTATPRTLRLLPATPCHARRSRGCISADPGTRPAEGRYYLPSAGHDN